MNELIHYGTPRHSGRYPWGSGGEYKYQRGNDLYSVNKRLRLEGNSEKETAQLLGMSINELRNRLSIESASKKAARNSEVIRLVDQGDDIKSISAQTGLSKQTINNILKNKDKATKNEIETIKNVIKDNVDKHKYVDVGKNVNLELGVSATKMKAAIQDLVDEDHKISYLSIPQLGVPGNFTSVKVISKKDVAWKEINDNRDKIGLINQRIVDGKAVGLRAPQKVDPKRLGVNYNSDKDGVIELRRGIKDLDLGESKYAQVRIAIGDSHYIKGMAVYSDSNLPKGIDIRFNTSKSNTGNKLEVLKSIKSDPKDPFGSYIKPGGQKGALNIVNEEGDWGKWSRTLASQMLSKQSPSLVSQQLKITKQNKESEYNSIKAIKNPVLREKLLGEFADSCDSSARYLKAASLPRQTSSVILPIKSLKENEIYAPSYKNGEKIALIRYPHGGRFEIPVLTVNNKNQEANRTMKNALDAVGIHPKAAQRLSGADFDGDTVVLIPNNSKKISVSKSLKELENFDPKISYPKYPGMPKMKEATKQNEMGKVSNLITDMTIKGANSHEIARAVKHSMVVIDARNHDLNYKQSYIDNGIASLKEKYQGGATKGASTLLSRANAKVRVPEESRYYKIDSTGQKIYTQTGRTKTDKSGKETIALRKKAQIDLYPDAHKLSSGTKIEKLYADYANEVRALGNRARKEAAANTSIPMSNTAKTVYKKEVDSLLKKLAGVQKNSPLERKAQALGNRMAKTRIDALGEEKDDPDSIKKIRGKALTEARLITGAYKNPPLTITQKEYEAINAGAVSKTRQKEIFNAMNADELKKLAMPKTKQQLSSTKQALIKQRIALGYTRAEVAESLGISVSSVANVLTA